MKCLHALSRVAVTLFALALALCLGCTKPAEEATGVEPAPAGSEGSDEGPVTIVEGTPLIWFVDTDEVAQLRSDMQEGRIPTSCNVLYDQSGTLPDVTVTDPDTIKAIYELVQGMVVPESGRAMSVTDSYHHVIFTLQDEGVHNLYWNGKNYPVANDDGLWALVRQLQDEQMAGN